MEELKDKIRRLETPDESCVVYQLQNIMDYLVNNFQLCIKNGGKTVILDLLEIEAYYCNKHNFHDACVHGHFLQKGEKRFGKIYIHRYKRTNGDSPFIRGNNRAGMDLCLSLGDYALAFLIRNATVNDYKDNGSHPAKLVEKVFDELALNYEAERENLKKIKNIAQENIEKALLSLENECVLKKRKEPLNHNFSETDFSERIGIGKGLKDAPLRLAINS